MKIWTSDGDRKNHGYMFTTIVNKKLSCKKSAILRPMIFHIKSCACEILDSPIDPSRSTSSRRTTHSGIFYRGPGRQAIAGFQWIFTLPFQTPVQYSQFFLNLRNAVLCSTFHTKRYYGELIYCVSVWRLIAAIPGNAISVRAQETVAVHFACFV